MSFEMWKPEAIIVCVLLVASLGSANSVGNTEEIQIPTGSIWTYRYNETLNVPGSANLELEGIQTQWCRGLFDMVIGGNDSQAVEFWTSLIANVTGSVAQQNPFGATSWVTANGKLKISEHDYYDLHSGTLVNSDANTILDVRDGSGTTAHSVLYHDEHNETNYTSIIVSPPGLTVYSNSGNPVPGTNWTIEYFGFSNLEGVNGTRPFSYSFELHEKVCYTYVGPENVTVPAGSFDCRKIVYEYQGSQMMEWYCPELEGYAKITSSTSGDYIVNSLVSCHLEHEVIGRETNARYDPAILVIAVVLATAVVLTTVMLYLWKKKRPIAPQGMPQPIEKEVG